MITIGLQAQGGCFYVYHNFFCRPQYLKNSTELATGDSAEAVADGSGAAHDFDFMQLTKVTIPNTTFLKGDVLKLQVQVWGKRTDAAPDGGQSISLGHDPAGRDPETKYARSTTVLNFLVPFKIDV